MRLRNENPEIARGTSEILDTGEGAYTYDFPLRANWLYSIGHKSADIDEPEDLGGKMTDIVIDGNWQVDVDIPL